MNRQDKATPTAPPVAAPGASIDTPEFRNLLAAYARTWGSNSPAANFGLKMVDGELISHIDAHAAQRYEAGCSEGRAYQHKVNEKRVKHLSHERDLARAAVRDAEASLARLVEGVTNIAGDLKDTPFKPEVELAASQLLALLPAKADKPTEGDDHA